MSAKEPQGSGRAPSEPDKPTPLGIVCPRCGDARWRTTSTDRLPDRVRRYRTCASCSQHIVTYESTARFSLPVGTFLQTPSRKVVKHRAPGA
jgi:predicted RNA-binding Zn-ribbon protein involved in translation (DUF1610 family)